MDKLLVAFLEALPLPIVGIDRLGRVILWNAGAEAVLGWTAAEVVEKPYPAVPHGLQEAHERLREFVFQGHVVPRHETRRRRKDGSEFDVVITIAGARGADGSIDSSLAVFHDLTPMRDAQRRLRSAGEQLRRFSSALNHLQEAERRRIAREVHDELGQRLTSLRLDLGLLRNEWHEGELEKTGARIANMFDLIDETLGTVRRVATALRPAVLDDFGFRAALEQELSSFRKRTGITMTSSFCPEDLAVDAERATALYRIVQEAMTNIARHAGATCVEVHIEVRSDDILAEIVDDGRGITAEEIDSETTLGLLGMRERASAFGGAVIIEGSQGCGTRVLVRVPR
jgi:two-component system sensor histidine kinase UhpB